MATDIVIPNVGESVTEGVIAAWVKQDGDYVEQDETVLELETDKITMEVPAPASGVVKTSAAEGDTVEVGAVVGSIDESAEKPSGGSAKGEQKSEAASDGGKDKAEASSAAATSTAEKPTDKKSSGQGSIATKDQDRSTGDSSSGTRQPAASSGAGSNGEVHATPLARKIAEEYRVDLSAVVGTGAGHRIREQDVLAAVQSGQTGKHAGGQAGSGEAPSGGPSRATKRERMTPLRQRIATRLVEAQQTAAMLTTFNEVDMGAVMDLRKRYKESFSEKHGVNLGFMSFFVKATVSALRAFPLINAYIVNDESGKPSIESHDYCDIAMAVSSPKGLVVPVLRNCETLSFAQVEKGVKDLAVRARDGKLDLSEMQGGTFTITNGGIFGSLMSTPILNPPQSGILGMHAIKNRPAEDPSNPGQIAMRPMMYLALSYDHRIVDGAEAVQFLVHIKECIEDPNRLLIDA